MAWLAKGITCAICHAQMDSHCACLEKRMIEKFKEQDEDLARMREALEGLCREKSQWYPQGCWCGSCLNDPNMGGRHSEACLKAQAALYPMKP